MIIQYDTRPDATIDEKLRSLIHSIQLALGEVGIREDSNVTSQTADITALSAAIRQLSDEISTYAASIEDISESVTGLDERVTELEGRQELPEAPTEDGAYRLTVTVTDGTPVYTWEVAE